MKLPHAQLRIGILGGGQLARILVLKGHELGFEMHVLSEHKEDPAAQVTQHWTQGSLFHKATLKSFLKSIDVGTFESEFLDGHMLQELCRNNGFSIYPRPYLMEQLQDRLTQKKLFEKHSLPSAPYTHFKSPPDWGELNEQFPKGFVIKKRKFGYDGYGTFVIKNENDYIKFKSNTDDHTKSVGFIAESYVNFKREMSLICIRNRSGQFKTLPLNETFQKDSICYWVKGPSTHKGIKSIIKKANQFLNAINYVGVFAIELFDDGKRLLINEIAPRVHNTGHHSLNSLTTDQFTYHLLAIVNADLPTPRLCAPGYAMVNLLGQKKVTPKWKLSPNVHMHWYGKKENRPGRKMGHLNSVASTPNKALQIALAASKEVSI